MAFRRRGGFRRGGFRRGGFRKSFGSRNRRRGSAGRGRILVSRGGIRSWLRMNIQKNLEMWNLQNKYNTPESQMERLGSAGLNPNLVYGAGARFILIN